MRQFFVLLLLVVYIFLPIPLDNYSKIFNSTNYEHNVLPIDSVESKFSKFGKLIEVIFFATSKVEFEQFLEIGKIKRSYPNLEAVRLDVSSQSYYQLMKQFPDQIFPSQIFDSLKLHSQNVIPHDFRFDNTQTQDLTQIDELWNQGYNGTGVVAVVFDNGVDFSHPALEGKKFDVFSVASKNTQPCKTHGTPVAGMLAASPTSLEPDVKGTGFGAQLIDISLGCSGDTISGNFLEGFDYILENNDTIDVINTSFGGFAPPWDFITEKIEQSGIVIVGSAGNEGPFEHSTTTGGPGNSIHGISAGAINSDGNLPVFSSRGPVIDMLFKPDLVAPGVGLKAPLPDDSYGSVQGTSFSSPIIAGGVASLISALEANGLGWNPGVIKAAMLRSANTISTNELATGQGIVNFNETWQLLQNIEKDITDTPEIVMITPKSGPIHYLRNIPQGEIVKVPITLISSHPLNTILSFSGDLNGISTHSALENKYSQKVVVNIDTSSLSPNQQIVGNITAQIGSDTVNSEIKIELGEKIKAKIGLDLHHTYWDQIGSDEIGGGNTGEMIKLAMEAGYWLEEIDTTLTDSLLQDYDILWLPDPNNLMHANNPSLTEMGFTEFPLLESEISALTNFVSNGGSIFVDSNGYRNDSENNSEKKIGLNSTGLNLLLSNFDIFTNEIPIPEPAGHTTVSTLNLTSLVKGVEKITHFGNYLTVGETGWAVSRDNGGRITNAYYIDENSGGKVMVAGTNFWMDNFGIQSLYTNAGDNNPILAANLWDWFTNPITLVKLSDISTNSSISGSYKLLINGSLTSEEPNLYLEQNQFHSRQNVIAEKQNDGSYQFDFSFENTGIYRIIAEYQGKYIAWENIIDNQGPSIIAEDATLNGSILSEADNYLFTFIVKDDISGFDESSVEVFLNQEKIDPTIVYTQALEQLNIIIQDDTFKKLGSGPYTLQIIVKDKVGNLSFYTVVIDINGQDQNSSLTSDTETLNSVTRNTRMGFLSLFSIFWILPILIILVKNTMKRIKICSD